MLLEQLLDRVLGVLPQYLELVWGVACHGFMCVSDVRRSSMGAALQRGDSLGKCIVQLDANDFRRSRVCSLKEEQASMTSIHVHVSFGKNEHEAIWNWCLLALIRVKGWGKIRSLLLRNNRSCTFRSPNNRFVYIHGLSSGVHLD
jgi:hypothetical protein